MGGRGAFNPLLGRTGGIPLEKREYSAIGYIDRVKIVQCNTKSNNPTIIYSNTANTVYYAYSKENKCIDHIYYYKNHKLVKSVDFKNNEVPHVHYWSSKIVGRKRHDAHNRLELTQRDKRLMNKAREYNEQHR